MATSILLVIAFLIIVVGTSLFLQATRQRRSEGAGYLDVEFQWMPPELRSARLEVSEQNMAVTLDGNRVPVRPDQVYRTADGRLIPVDTKVRKNATIFRYDLIELSLQRLALAQSSRYLGNARVADHGYIRIATRGGGKPPKYRRVELMSERDLVELYHRHAGIVAGTVAPTSQSNPRACAACGFVGRCPSAAR